MVRRQSQNKSSQSHLGRARRCRTIMRQSPRWLQWDAPNSPSKLLLPFDDNHLHTVHAYIDRPHSPPQTAPGSNQPFCHNTLSGQIDRPTDRPTDRRETCTKSAYATERRTNNNSVIRANKNYNNYRHRHHDNYYCTYVI